MNQKNYRIEIAKYDINKYNINIKNISKDDLMHYPIKNMRQGTCKNCSFTKHYKTKKTPTTRYKYNVYNIILCVNCFEEYHKVFLIKFIY